MDPNNPNPTSGQKPTVPGVGQPSDQGGPWTPPVVPGEPTTPPITTPEPTPVTSPEPVPGGAPAPEVPKGETPQEPGGVQEPTVPPKTPPLT